MPEELDRFREKRDRSIEGLTRCDDLPDELEILNRGFECSDFGAAIAGSEEHEFTVYTKGEQKIVFIQTYIEREGGLYFQSLFADEATVKEIKTWQKT